MNRRLFWKIFLPFWVAQALLLGALYLRLHVRLHSERPWWTQPSRQVMPQLGLDAALDYEHGGQPALDGFSRIAYRSKAEHRTGCWMATAGNWAAGSRPAIFRRTPCRHCKAADPCGSKTCAIVVNPSTPRKRDI